MWLIQCDNYQICNFFNSCWTNVATFYINIFHQVFVNEYTHTWGFQININFDNLFRYLCKSFHFFPRSIFINLLSICKYSGIILCMRPANERRCDNVTSSLIGWVHSQNNLWILSNDSSSQILLIYWRSDKMITILQMTFWNSYSCKKLCCVFWFKFHKSLLLMVQFTFSQLVHVIAWWRQVRSHYLN